LDAAGIESEGEAAKNRLEVIADDGEVIADDGEVITDDGEVIAGTSELIGSGIALGEIG
jgi:hypothetical protein